MNDMVGDIVVQAILDRDEAREAVAGLRAEILDLQVSARQSAARAISDRDEARLAIAVLRAELTALQQMTTEGLQRQNESTRERTPRR